MIFDRLLAQLFVTPGAVVLDIGAHEGESAALYLARRASTVISFEPRRAARERWPAGIREDPRLTLHPFGLSDHTGSAQIYVPSVGDGASSLDRDFVRRYRSEEGSEETVELRRIDDLDLPRAQVWKIDAEGSELEILRGAERTLAVAAPDILQVEIFLHDWSRYAATINFMLTRFSHVWGLGVSEAGKIICHPVTSQSPKNPAFHADLRRSGTPRYFGSFRPFGSWARDAAVK